MACVIDLHLREAGKKEEQQEACRAHTFAWLLSIRLVNFSLTPLGDWWLVMMARDTGSKGKVDDGDTKGHQNEEVGLGDVERSRAAASLDPCGV